MNVFQAAKMVDCGELLDKRRVHGRMTAGGRGRWVCPFHDDHEPSMVTYPRENGRHSHYYCFTCAAHGDVIDLEAKLSNCAPLDAAKQLCKEWGLSYDETPRVKLASAGHNDCEDHPELAVVIAICSEWQKFRISWYEEELERARKRQQDLSGWQLDMENQWVAYFESQLSKYKSLNDWEVLHDIREEFERLGVNPYRRLRYAGVVS